MEPIRTVKLTCHELLNLIAVIRVMKDVAVKNQDAEEEAFMADLIDKLLTYHLDDAGTTIELDTMTCFGMWMCMETYIEFCKSTGDADELKAAQTVANKLAGRE